MTVTSIQRDLNSNVCFVRMISTANLATIAQANYIANNQDAINALNGGTFGWFMSDMLLVAASDGNALFQFTDDTFDSLIIYGEQGSGVINPGLINEIAYYSANGTNISGLATANNGVLITSAGGIPSISSILPTAVQQNITNVGTLSVGIWQATPITVPYGGTGDTTFTAYAVICGGTTSTGTLQSVSGLGSVGDLLTSNGPGALPTFQSGVASGIIQIGNQNDLPYYSASPSGKTLSPIAGAINSVLITSGMGVPSLSQTLPSAVQGNITAVGTIASGTWNGSVIGATYGGTGVANPTAHGIMIAEGASAMTPIVLSSGQVLIGSTGVDPVAGAIGSGTGILVGNGAGSITVSLASIADQRILANISGISAAPTANSLTAIIDACIGSVQGDILYRNATSWVVLAPSTSGFVLTTGGAAANPAWASAPGATPAALTKTDDTNVTLTLGGSPTVALLAATSLTLGWTGQLGLTRGGTAASLTASNGGIVYSTASALAILAGTATAGQILRSGASTTPSWSTATYPATAGTQYNVLQSDGTNITSATLTSIIDGAIGSTQGDILYRNASGWVVLAPGTTGFFLQTKGASANPVWANGTSGSFTAPTVQSFTSGTAQTYTTPTSPSPLYLRVKAWGGGAGGSTNTSGGGGGGGSGAYCESIITSPAATYTYTVAASVAANTNGNASTFSAGTMSAGGGTSHGASGSGGGAGGTASGGNIVNLNGAPGGTPGFVGSPYFGGPGGGYGGGTGADGAGAGNGVAPGGGGGGNDSAGDGAGTGAAGRIVVEEYYQ